MRRPSVRADASQLLRSVESMTEHESRFWGQVAIVTGVSSGVGLAVAERLSSEGARVCGWDASQSGLNAAHPWLTASLQIDVSSEQSVEDATARTINELGSIDILIVNSAAAGSYRPTWEYPCDEWRRLMELNVNGAFITHRAVVPHMLARHYGRIVNVVSVSGKEGTAHAAAESASAAAVIGMTKSLGKELARTGVSVNAVTPAEVRTPAPDQICAQQRELMLSKIPRGRFGTASETAGLITWVASAECSFTTGAVFDISGGRSTY